MKNDILDARKRYYLGEVFVTFETNKMAERYLADEARLKYNEKETDHYLLRGNIIGLILGMIRAIKSKFTKKLKMKRAPKPKDIIWENLGIPLKQIVLRSLYSFIFTVLVVGCSFGITILIKYIQVKSTTIPIYYQRGLSLALGVVNFLSGKVVDFAIDYFNGSLEKHQTYSRQSNSLMIKVVFV